MNGDNNQRLWLILIGAMLASKQVREDATGKLLPDEAPDELVDLWNQITEGHQEEVRQIFRGWKVDVWADGVLPSITRHLQEHSAAKFCERLIARAQVTRLQTPEELRDKFVKMASALESRCAVLDKSKAEGREAAKKASQPS